jgi:hypothetical protein
MLHLNTIFEAEGLNTGKIQLIRHKDFKLQKKEGKVSLIFGILIEGDLRYIKAFRKVNLHLPLVVSSRHS